MQSLSSQSIDIGEIRKAQSLFVYWGGCVWGGAFMFALLLLGQIYPDKAQQNPK